jgi:hypothetical protein
MYECHLFQTRIGSSFLYVSLLGTVVTAPSGAVNSFVKKDALELSKRCLHASVPFLALIEPTQIPELFVVLLKLLMPAFE